MNTPIIWLCAVNSIIFCRVIQCSSITLITSFNLHIFKSTLKYKFKIRSALIKLKRISVQDLTFKKLLQYLMQRTVKSVSVLLTTYSVTTWREGRGENHTEPLFNYKPLIKGRERGPQFRRVNLSKSDAAVYWSPRPKSHSSLCGQESNFTWHSRFHI